MFKEGIIIILSCIFLLSCTGDNEFKSKIEKEFHKNGQLKTILYKFKNDDFQKIGFSQKGTIEYIQNISNNGKDNLMMIFDGNGELWMIEPNQNNQRNGTSIVFDKGNVVLEELYQDDILIK